MRRKPNTIKYVIKKGKVEVVDKLSEDICLLCER